MVAAKKLDGNPGVINVMASNMAKHITQEKIDYTWRTISKLRASKRFPPDNNFESYLGRRVSLRTRNASGALEAKAQSRLSRERIQNLTRSQSPEIFFRTMLAKEYEYVRPWVFRPISVGSTKELVDAVNYANATATRLYSWQARGPIVQAAARALLLVIRQPNGRTYPVVSGVPDASRLTRGSELFLVNTSTWAAYAEAVSVEIWKQDGMLYHTAKLTAAKFPKIDVTFTYTNNHYGPKLGLPLGVAPNGKLYMRPVIKLSLRGEGGGKRSFSKPGRNIRRRRRAQRKRNRSG